MPDALALQLSLQTQQFVNQTCLKTNTTKVNALNTRSRLPLLKVCSLRLAESK